MFDFLNMFGNYEDRKVDRFEKDDIIVSTAFVTDTGFDYETAVSHPQYNSGKFIIVEQYETEEEAQIGHNKWVNLMTTDNLPEQLIDVSTATCASMIDLFSEDEWRIFKKGENE